MIGVTRETLRDIVQRTCNVLTIWDGAATPFTPPHPSVAAGLTFPGSVPTPTTALAGQAIAMLAIRSGKIRGRDEARTELHVPSGLLVTTIAGVREYNLTLRVESYIGDDASEILERFRTRVRRAGIRAELYAAGLSVAFAGDVVDLPLTKDTRAVGFAACDFTLNWSFNDLDPTAEGVYVATAGITDLTD